MCLCVSVRARLYRRVCAIDEKTFTSVTASAFRQLSTTEGDQSLDNDPMSQAHTIGA